MIGLLLLLLLGAGALVLLAHLLRALWRVVSLVGIPLLVFVAVIWLVEMMGRGTP